MVSRQTGLRAGLATPIGPIWAETDGTRLTATGWGAAPAPGHPLLHEALAQLAAFFDGRLTAFDLPLALPDDPVIRTIAAIPHGETRTYGDLARATGLPPQAVGQACGRNPLPIVVPCHRVLGTGRLGGFSAPGGIETKVWLLRHEGAAGLLI